jgi:hypothetical protein
MGHEKIWYMVVPGRVLQKYVVAERCHSEAKHLKKPLPNPPKGEIKNFNLPVHQIHYSVKLIMHRGFNLHNLAG